MHSKVIIVLLVGLVASSFALDLSHADPHALESEPRLFSFLNDFYGKVVYPPLNHVVTSLSLLTAQVLVGISETGIPGPKGRMLHPSDAQLRGFFDDMWNNGVKPPLENALSGLSLVAAQLLASLGTDGVNLSSLFGKRDLSDAEMRGFADALSQAFSSVFTNVMQKPMEEAMASGALMLAQVLAGLGTNGVNLSSLAGKRDLSDAEMRGFIDTLSQAFSSVFTNVMQKPMEDAMASGALMLAQVLAGLGTNGVNLSSLAGKRDLSAIAGREEELRGFFDKLGQGILAGLEATWSNVIKEPMQDALQSGALMAAQVLAGISATGVSLGKRSVDARGSIFGDLVSHANSLVATQVKPTVENAINNAILQLAGALANFSNNQLGRR